jgi:hypothetical protein
MRNPILFAALALGACSTVPAEGSEPALAGACKDDSLATFVGKEATEVVGSELLKQSGANALRWVPKGSMVTMEFRADRVTAYLDGNNKIERVNCG